MFTICLPQRPSACYGPTDATVAVAWNNTIDPTECAETEVDVFQTWTNPCAEAYAISYYYEAEWDANVGGSVIVYTGPTLTATIAAGGPTTIGPDHFVVPVDPSAYSVGRIYLHVTWPDSTVVTYVSYDDFLAQCQ